MDPVVNIYAHKIGAPKYIKKILRDIREKLTETQQWQGTLIPHLLQWTDHPDKKINKETLA